MVVRLELDVSRDPLRVLESTQPIVEQARLVRIDQQQVQRAAALIEGLPAPTADWDRMLHPISDDPAKLANLVLVVDALNFCFWSLPGSDRPRWQVTYQGTTYDGYAALAVALRRAVEGGYPLWDGDLLGTITEAEVTELLAGDPGSEAIPLLHARMTHLREVGVALVERWDGSFLHAIRAARGSAPRLVAEVLRALPSFRDTAPWGQREGSVLQARADPCCRCVRRVRRPGTRRVPRPRHSHRLRRLQGATGAAPVRGAVLRARSGGQDRALRIDPAGQRRGAGDPRQHGLGGRAAASGAEPSGPADAVLRDRLGALAGRPVPAGEHRPISPNPDGVLLTKG